MMGIGFIWMLLFWGGLIALAVWLISTLFPAATRPSTTTPPSASARDILDGRYARGELTAEQYQDMRHTLEQ